MIPRTGSGLKVSFGNRIAPRRSALWAIYFRTLGFSFRLSHLEDVIGAEIEKSPLTEISGLKSYELFVCYRNLSAIAEFQTHFWRKLGVNWRKLWHKHRQFLGQSIELCACRNVRINHQQMQLFLAVFVMHGGDEHTAGIDTHHRSRRQIGDGDAGLSNQFFRLIIFVNTTQNDPIYAGSVVQNEL